MSQISIAHVGRRIAALTGKPGPTHQQVYSAVLRGAVPAEFRNGRWFMQESDVPLVAQALGIPLPTDASAAA